MNLLRMIQMWLGTSDEAVFESDDHGNGNSGGNSSIWFSHSTKGRPNAPAASMVHRPGMVGWVGRPHQRLGQFTVRLRYDTPEARDAAIRRLTADGSVAKITVPVIPRKALPHQENPPAEMALRW